MSDNSDCGYLITAVDDEDTDESNTEEGMHRYSMSSFRWHASCSNWWLAWIGSVDNYLVILFVASGL